jgi:putative aldouronate transport system substrate-binding protein
MKRKVIALLLVATLLISLAACSKEDDSSNSSGGSTDSKSSTNSSSKEAVIDTSEAVTIKYMITGNKPTNGRTEEMLEVLNEKANGKSQCKIRYLLD